MLVGLLAGKAADEHLGVYLVGAADQAAVAQMEIGLVIETVAGWLRTNEMAQRRWHELTAGERGMVDAPSELGEHYADRLARSTSLETLQVYGAALRGTLAVLTRVQAAHADEIIVVWQEPEGVSGNPYPDDVDGEETTAGGQQLQDRLAELEARLARVEANNDQLRRVLRAVGSLLEPDLLRPAADSLTSPS